MTSIPIEMKKNVCYRCRNTASVGKELMSCSHCTLFWHLECIEPPPVPPLGKEWMCPHHQKPVDLKKRSGNKSSKSKARADIIESFEEADNIVKYGGVIHDISEKTIEDDFLDYARRYREFNRADKKLVEIPSDGIKINDTKLKTEAEEWLDNLSTFEFYETNHTGIQMLIDAANIKSEKDVSLDEMQYERFEAIQELIDLKGEDNLLEMLSAEGQ